MTFIPWTVLSFTSASKAARNSYDCMKPPRKKMNFAKPYRAPRSCFHSSRQERKTLCVTYIKESVPLVIFAVNASRNRVRWENGMSDYDEKSVSPWCHLRSKNSLLCTIAYHESSTFSSTCVWYFCQRGLFSFDVKVFFFESRRGK